MDHRLAPYLAQNQFLPHRKPHTRAAMKHLLTSANRTDTAPPRHIGPQQRAVRALATVLVPSTLATLLLLDARQPGAEPEASGREVPSFVLAALPGEDEHTVLALRTEPMST